jgi:DUF2934 family protein
MAKTLRKSESQSAADRSSPQAGGDAATATPDRERVAVRAYELYLARGAGDGEELDDWLCAERELYSEESREAPASVAGARQARRSDEEMSASRRGPEEGSRDDR